MVEEYVGDYAYSSTSSGFLVSSARHILQVW
jgi:hypothetical protein